MVLIYCITTMSNSKEDNDGSADGEIATILQPSSISNNMFDKLTKYIDDNIRLFRYTPWLVGGAGLLLLLGSANMARRYRGTMAVPQRSIDTNSTLRGRVVKCDNDSLYVWHIPLLRLLTRIRIHPPTSVNVDELIKVQFTGVSIATNHAASCLNRITGSPVRLKLLYKNEHSAIECVVHSWRSRWFYYAPRKRYCVNEELISLGVATLIEPRGFIDTAASINFLQQLARQERRAQIKGRGVWRGTDHVSSWNKVGHWVNSKVGRSSNTDMLKEASLPIPAVAKEMSSEHRH